MKTSSPSHCEWADLPAGDFGTWIVRDLEVALNELRVLLHSNENCHTSRVLCVSAIVAFTLSEMIAAICVGRTFDQAKLHIEEVLTSLSSI